MPLRYLYNEEFWKEFPYYIKTIKKDNKFVLDRNIPLNIITVVNNSINNILKKYKIPIKGSRALNLFVPKSDKIFTEDEEKYVDFDIYSDKPKKLAIEIANELIRNGIKYVSVSNILIKIYIYRIHVFTFPLVDIQFVPRKVINILPLVLRNKLFYLKPEYLKMDMYVQLGRPVISNAINWLKIIDRLVLLEKYYPFKEGQERINYKQNPDHLNLIKHLLPVFHNKCDVIITGNMAYHILMNTYVKGNYYKPPLNYLEILTCKIGDYIEEINKILGKDNIKILRYSRFIHTIYPYSLVLYKNQPLVFIYYLHECTSYQNFKGINVSTYYYTNFYYIMIKSLSKINTYLQPNLITEICLYNLLIIKKRKIILNCIVDINPNLLELKTNLKKRIKVFRYNPRNKNTLIDPNTVRDIILRSSNYNGNVIQRRK